MTNTDEARRRHNRRVNKEIRERFDVEMLHGQWCGPNWEAAEAYDREHSWKVFASGPGLDD